MNIKIEVNILKIEVEMEVDWTGTIFCSNAGLVRLV